MLKHFRKKSQLLIIALVVGFLIGIIYENLNVKRTGITIDIFQRFYLDKFSETSVVSERLFWYIVRARLVGIVSIIVLGGLRWKKAGMVLFCGWTGFLYGVLVVASIIQLGMAGLVVSVAGMFPHLLFYVPATVLLVINIYDYPRKAWNWPKTIFILLMVMLGVVLESYLNPFIMKLVVKMI